MPAVPGSAAPQIGVNLRVFTYVVIDKEMEDYGSMGHIVNPVLVEQSPDEVTDNEGCLSIPGLEYELARSRRVVAEGFGHARRAHTYRRYGTAGSLLGP